MCKYLVSFVHFLVNWNDWLIIAAILVRIKLTKIKKWHEILILNLNDIFIRRQTNSQVIPSLKIKPLWKRVVDWPKLLAYLIKWPKCTCVYVADACLRCQAENKQEDCVGKEINCSTPEVLNQNAVNCRWRPVSVTWA